MPTSFINIFWICKNLIKFKNNNKIKYLAVQLLNLKLLGKLLKLTRKDKWEYNSVNKWIIQ